MKWLLVLLALSGLSLGACGGTPTPNVEETAEAANAATPKAQPTETTVPEPKATLPPTPTPSSPPPSPTRTRAPAPTSTPTTTPARTPASIPTPLPTRTPAAAPVDCPALPEGGFLTIWKSDPSLQASLGCPTSLHPRVTPAAWEVNTAYQPFERGVMMWSDHTGWQERAVVFVLYANSTYQRIEDTFDPAADPAGGDETPPDGLVEPVLGFGKAWRDQPGVRDALGWATASETPGGGRFQMFEGGNMVWISQTDQTYVFIGQVVRTLDVPY